MDSTIPSNSGVIFNPIVYSEYRYEYDDVSDVSQEIGKSGNKIETSVKYKVALLYKITHKTASEYEAAVRFISCDVVNISRGVGVDGSLEKDSTYFHKNIGSLKGLELNLVLNFWGKIIYFAGYNDYLNKCLALNETPLSENFFRDPLGRISEILPEKKLFVGSSWNRRALQRDGIDFENSSYVFDSIRHEVAYMHSSCQVKQKVSAFSSTLEMEGKENSDIQIELNSGLALYTLSRLKLAGSSKIGGIDVVQCSIRTFRMLGKRIKV
jgi:hypothetical protein